MIFELSFEYNPKPKHMKNSSIKKDDFYSKISDLLITARKTVVQSINKTVVVTYYEIGRIIVEEEQSGRPQANYGQFLISQLSIKLTAEFGRGFSVTNLKQIRTFYLTYSKSQTVSDLFNLSWSHYLILMRIDNLEERRFYELESTENNWSIRELKRQFDSALYERLSLSRNKSEVRKLSEKGQIIERAQDTLKDPYILEFLGLPEEKSYSESEFEQRLIDKLENFLLELGKGYTFVGRQVRFTFDEKHFHIDLVFYNRILQCFVLIDLKIGEINHQDLGQMQMYVNYYDRHVKLTTENKTIGIILCKKKNDTLVEITLPENNEQIYASKYLTVLPSKKALKDLINNKLE